MPAPLARALGYLVKHSVFWPGLGCGLSATKFTIMQGRNFEVNIISTVKTTKHLKGEYLEEWLNQNFRLFKYGGELEEIFILFSVEGDTPTSRYQHHPEDHFLELAITLPERELHNAEAKETLLLMASALLTSLQSIPKHAVGSFDISSFRADFAEMVA